jgi:ketosteroid isomerase-like protein
MSEENVELVRALQPSGGVDLAELFAGEPSAFVDAMAPLLDPSFECAFIANESSGFTTMGYRGAEGFAEGWREWLSPWESYRIDAEEFIDAGEQVVVLARVQARTRRGGVDMEHAPGAVWTIEDGRVRRVEFYLERSQALAVARGRGSQQGA